MKQLETQLRNSLALADAPTETLIAELKHRAEKENDRKAKQLFRKQEETRGPRP